LVSPVEAIQVAANGTPLWRARPSALDSTSVDRAAATPSGGAILAGAVGVAPGLVGMRIEASSGTSWTRTYVASSAARTDYAAAGLPTADGGFLLAGVQSIGITCPTLFCGAMDSIHIVKTDRNGNTRHAIFRCPAGRQEPLGERRL